MCGCFGNICTCIYCVLYCLYCVFVLFRSYIFILICFVCISQGLLSANDISIAIRNDDNNNTNNKHYSICRVLGIESTDKWYTHMPKPVCEEDVTVLWNQAVHTDRQVTANRPDIIKTKKEKTCTLKDVAILADRNVVQKEAEKKLKFKSLCIEIERMWNLKCTIVPVIIGATGIVTRSLKKNLETIPGKHSIDSLQKTAILETTNIIRKVLQCEA